MDKNEPAFQWRWSKGVPYGFFPDLSQDGLVTHGFSTRQGGISRGVYSSMNFWFNCEDNPAHVQENFRRYTAALDVELERAVLTHQTHETRIRMITEKDVGKGFAVPRDYERIDGLMTNIKGIPLMTFHADCIPIYLTDPENRAIGLAHAGWRGTVNQIAVEIVERMRSAYGTRPENVIAGIGPSIGQCCFKIHDDVHNQFLELLPFTKKMFLKPNSRQWSISLQDVTRILLHGTGIPMDSIFLADICTCCHHQLFFSHRVHGTERGTMGALIQLND